MDTRSETTWLTVNGLADHFKMSRSTVYRWLDEGCPSHRPRGRALFDLTEVEAWIRSRCSAAAPVEPAA